MKPYQIILADDHALFRQGIKRIIEENEGLKVIGEAGDGFECLDLLKGLNPDMAILDISMPKLRGIEATREIKKSHPEIHILILTMFKDLEYLYHAINVGADGYLLKEDADEELFTAIESIRKFITHFPVKSFSLSVARDVAGARNTVMSSKRGSKHPTTKPAP